MREMRKSARFWSLATAAALVVALLVMVAAGCGSTSTTSSGTTASTVAKGAGKLYVAVTGSGELTAGTGNMGYAVVDLATKKIDMVNISESKAPHGISFTPDEKTVANTQGRVTNEAPKSIFLGNAQDGTVLQIDLSTQKVTKTITPPSTAKLAICGMDTFTDGKIYLSSMGDGMLYPLDPSAGTISQATVGGGDATTSVCGVVWTNGGTTAYIDNMFNPKDASIAGYLAKVEWPSGTLIKKIENVTKPSPSGATLSHQLALTPDGKYIYVADGVDGSIVKIDTSNDQILKTIPIGKEPHSMVFSSDGKTAYISVRHEPVENESSIFVYDVEKDQITDRIPGIAAPLICGVILAES